MEKKFEQKLEESKEESRQYLLRVNEEHAALVCFEERFMFHILQVFFLVAYICLKDSN